MKNKILIVGTSHVATFKLGWNILQKKYGTEFEIDFISSPAGAWKLMNKEKGFVINNNQICCFNNLEFYLKKAGVLGSDIPIAFKEIKFTPTKYNIILFVDLATNLSERHFIRSNEDVIYYKSRPVSMTCLLSSKLCLFSAKKIGFSFTKEKIWVEEHNPFKIIELTRKQSPLTKVYFIDKPIVLAKNSPKFYKIKDSKKNILMALNTYESVMSQYLKKNNVSFIGHSNKTICQETGFTDNKYSVDLNKDNIKLNPHMNQDYGVIQLTYFLNMINAPLIH